MFSNLKVGDKVTRMLAGTIPMELTVTEIKDGVITCEMGYQFNAKTGGEIDDYFGWTGEPNTLTGSYITKKE
jgi:hypothetical protein